MNYKLQNYKGIPLRQIQRNYDGLKARRFTLNETNQNVWIPCRYLLEDGTIKENVNIDFVFKGCKRKFELAGIKHLYAPYKMGYRP